MMALPSLISLIWLLLWVGENEGTDFRSNVTVDYDIGPSGSANTLKPDQSDENEINKNSEDGMTQIAVIDEENIFSALYNGLSNSVSRVYSSASSVKDEIFSRVSNMTSDFVEKVRTILRDEFLDLVSHGFLKSLAKVTAPGMINFTCRK